MVLRETSHKILTYGLSDIGLVRKRNEDVWAELPNLHFYVLADGMGGHRAGDIAAREAVQAMCYLMNKKLKKSSSLEKPTLKLMREAMIQANRIVFKLGSQHPHLKGMGTTLCCLRFEEDQVIYGHVGDSRIYRFREGKLIQLTDDHSLMRELLDVGRLEEKDTGDFLYKNIITKAIGTEQVVEPSVAKDSVRIDDLYLICSDGLTDEMSDLQIKRVLDGSESIEMGAKGLVQGAIDLGGIDNVTVVLLKVVERGD